MPQLSTGPNVIASIRDRDAERSKSRRSTVSCAIPVAEHTYHYRNTYGIDCLSWCELRCRCTKPPPRAYSSSSLYTNPKLDMVSPSETKT
jgi:hypothetical protein